MKRLALAAAGAAFALAGCGSHPGDAVVVGDESMTMSDFNDLSSAFCKVWPQVRGQDGESTLAGASVRADVLDQVTRLLAARVVANEDGVEPSEVQMTLSDNLVNQAVDSLNGVSANEVRAVAGVQAETTALEAAIGRGDADGQPSQSDQSAGARQVNNYLKSADVSFDPSLTENDGSLSIAADASRYADYRGGPSVVSDVEALPANQVCSS